jgi:hypothetical protein
LRAAFPPIFLFTTRLLTPACGEKNTAPIVRKLLYFLSSLAFFCLNYSGKMRLQVLVKSSAGLGLIFAAVDIIIYI